MDVLVILRALGLGDLLTAVPALRGLARAFPDHERVLLAPAWLEPLTHLMGGAVHRVVDTGGVRRPPADLPAVADGAGVAVNLHGRGPQSTALLRAAGPRRLIAFGERAQWREGEHEVLRWVRLLRAEGIEADPDELDLVAPPGPSPAPGATVIHPGASAPARRWPPERWAALAAQLPGPVVVTVGPGEEPLAVAVARGTDARVQAGGLLDLARLVAGARVVLCADTGVAHLATALGTPSVVLFGPTSPREWGPPPSRPQHRVLWAGQRGDPNDDEPHPGLLAIEPADVLGALKAPVASAVGV
jgi:ADP-heptose:LPS heptosyltransferase